MRFEALPVAIDLPGQLGAEVAAFVEAEAGWQVVAPGGALSPRIRLSARPVGDDCVVVVEGPPDADTVHRALAAGALDVVAWPDDRIRLLEAPSRIRRAAPASGGPPVLRVAGCAGGVGTSTVALAIGGLLAWTGRRAVVIGDDALLALGGMNGWPGPGAWELATLDAADAATEVDAVAQPVSAVPGLALLGLGSPWEDRHDARRPPPLAEVLRPQGWPVDAVIIDAGVSRSGEGADLVCARPDAGLRPLVAAAPGRRRVPVVLIGDGPLSDGAVTRLLGHRPFARLPASARVARAGAAGRVPAALPGKWLLPLRTAIAGMAR